MTDPRKTYDPRGDAIALDALEARARKSLANVMTTLAAGIDGRAVQVLDTRVAFRRVEQAEAAA